MTSHNPFYDIIEQTVFFTLSAPYNLKPACICPAKVTTAQYTNQFSKTISKARSHNEHEQRAHHHHKTH